MRMEKSEMVNLLIEHYGKGNKAEFARLVGLSPQAISSWIARNTLDIELVYAKCKGVSADWLLSCEGEMLRPTPLQNADEQTKALFNLCKSIIKNYQEREKAMLQLNSMVRGWER